MLLSDNEFYYCTTTGFMLCLREVWGIKRTKKIAGTFHVASEKFTTNNVVILNKEKRPT